MASHWCKSVIEETHARSLANSSSTYSTAPISGIGIAPSYATIAAAPSYHNHHVNLYTSIPTAGSQISGYPNQTTQHVASKLEVPASLRSYYNRNVATQQQPVESTVTHTMNQPYNVATNYQPHQVHYQASIATYAPPSVTSNSSTSQYQTKQHQTIIEAPPMILPNHHAQNVVPKIINNIAPPVASTKELSDSQQTLLKQFIRRCLSSCKENEETKLMTEKLKAIIAEKTKAGFYDWTNEPIPELSPLKKADSPRKKQSEHELPASNDSLKNFVQRSLLSCSNDEERKLMSTKLEKLMLDIRNSGVSITTYKWDREPIPLVFVEKVQEKKRKSTWLEDESGNVKFSVTSNISSPKKVSSSSILQNGINEDSSIRQARANRFNTDSLSSTNNKKKAKITLPTPTTGYSNHSSDLSEFDIEKLKIVGTCLDLEKDYFRLTSIPLPSSIRPPEVLKKSLSLIKKKWRKGNVEYLYICSQLKAIRQDLTVQGIQDEFVVQVYETHARIALECGDLNEYNQCQTQLKDLYNRKITGSFMEFLAYRILYFVYLQGNKKYQSGSSDLMYVMQSLSDEAIQ